MNILTLLIPGLVAVLGNLVFYSFIKGKVDKSIERQKISYSWIYKEKIEIHKEILRQLFQLKLKIQQYQYSGEQKLGEELFFEFNQFITYYTVSQPFLNTEILNGLKYIRKELQGCFEDFHMHNSLSRTPGIEPKIANEALKKFFESGNKFKRDEPFKQIEEMIISEMRKDLQIE